MGWRLLFPIAAVLTVLLVATWHAGRESGQLDGQRLSAELDVLTQKAASNQLALNEQRRKTSALEKALNSAGKSPNLGLVTQLHQQLLQAQAEANQYKTILQREGQKSTDDQLLVEVLSGPGAHLLTMKAAEGAGECNAYALFRDNGKLLFVASHLPKLAQGREFQLWVLRKQEPKIVSAGLFSADENRRALMTFDDPSLMLDLAQLTVTDEPDGGSSEPTGVKLLETASTEKSE